MSVKGEEGAHDCGGGHSFISLCRSTFARAGIFFFCEHIHSLFSLSRQPGPPSPTISYSFNKQTLAQNTCRKLKPSAGGTFQRHGFNRKIVFYSSRSTRAWIWIKRSKPTHTRAAERDRTRNRLYPLARGREKKRGHDNDRPTDRPTDVSSDRPETSHPTSKRKHKHTRTSNHYSNLTSV